MERSDKVAQVPLGARVHTVLESGGSPSLDAKWMAWVFKLGVPPSMALLPGGDSGSLRGRAECRCVDGEGDVSYGRAADAMFQFAAGVG